MAALTISDKAEKFDKIQQKAEVAKLEGKVFKLRLTEAGTLALFATGLGAFEAYKPDADEWFHGIASPKALTTVAGVGLFVVAGKSRKSDYVREIGAGMAFAGGTPLLYKLGAYIYNKIAT